MPDGYQQEYCPSRLTMLDCPQFSSETSQFQELKVLCVPAYDKVICAADLLVLLLKQ